MVIIYGRNPFDSLKHAIAHEYSHVLQQQLAPYLTHAVKPYWIVEGFAQYADYAYSQSRPDRSPFFDRYSPYSDLRSAIDRKVLTPSELEWLADIENFREGCIIHPFYTYAMAFAALTLLVEQAEEDSYVRYWSLLHDHPTWQQAFEGSFGIDIEDFYRAFEEWLPSQLPPPTVRLTLTIRWPDMEAPIDVHRFSISLSRLLSGYWLGGRGGAPLSLSHILLGPSGQAIWASGCNQTNARSISLVGIRMAN